MKNLKAVGLAVVLVFSLLAVTAVAVQGEGNRQDGENASEKGLEMRKPLKAENVKIYKKKVLSAKERTQVDYAESQMKGKPSIKPGKPEKDGEAAIATGLLGNPLEAGAKKYAIVIGLANYAGIAQDLCVKDAKTPLSNNDLEPDTLESLCMDEDSRNMEGVLTGKYYKGGDYYNYGYDSDNVYRFSDSEATFDAIKSAIDTIIYGDTDNGKIPAAPGDEVVFFFSGHGATGDAPDGYGDEGGLDEAIVIYDQDYKKDDFVNNTDKYAENYIPGDSAYIWDGQLKALFEEAQTDRILFVFDTCRAGGMDDLMEGKTTDSDGVGRVLVTSSAENQSSFTYYLGGENGQESEGMFTHYFVKRAIMDERADGYNALKRKDKEKYDGNIAIEEAFQYAKPMVLKETQNYQEPVLNDLFANDLLLGYYLPTF